MQRLGSPSWSLHVSGSGTLDALLHVRDALRLPADGATDPPTWTTPVAPAWWPDGHRIDEGGADAAQHTARAWRLWWRDVAARELLVQGADLVEGALVPSWVRDVPPVHLRDPVTPADLAPPALARRHEPLVRRAMDLTARDLGRPPDFSALPGPVLRPAAVALWPAARAWVEQRHQTAEGTESATAPDLPHELIARTAQEAAFDAGASIDRARARLLLVEVPSPWSQQWSPGVVLASRRAVADPATARPILYAAFRSAAAA